MRAFTYEKPSNLEAARKTVVEKADVNQPPTLSSVQYIAGGTNLADYMRLNVARPERVSGSRVRQRQLPGRALATGLDRSRGKRCRLPERQRVEPRRGNFFLCGDVTRPDTADRSQRGRRGVW